MMNDVREKLVELLTEDCHFGQNCIGDCAGCLADYMIAHGVTVKDVEIDTVKPVTDCHGLGEWIPVTERFPYAEDVFLCWSKDLADMMFCYTSDFKQMKVTHWLPLPTPPKGECDG